jgi:hypothetical protein
MTGPKDSVSTHQNDDEDFGELWRGYIRAVRECMVSIPDDRSADQLLGLRDKVLRLVEDEDLVKALKDKFAKWAPKDVDAGIARDVKDIVREELRCFPRILEVEKAVATEASTGGWKARIPSLLGRASVINGSIKDLMGDVPALTVFGELLDLFKGRS